MTMKYVVWFREHLRDGKEDGARCVSTLDSALELINKLANGFAGANMEFKLYHLGDEVPLTSNKTEVEAVIYTKTKTIYRANE